MRKLGVPGNRYSEVLSVLHFCAADKPFFPNLEFLQLWFPTREFIPVVPLFFSPRITTISISFDWPDSPKAMIASMITTFPTLCPNLKDISLYSMPRDPMITAGVSKMLLASNASNARDTLRCLRVDSPLSGEACKAISKHTNLRELSAVIEGDTSLPTVVPPNPIDLTIGYDHDYGWLQGLRGATLGKLVSVTFRSESERIGGFLEAFESVALTTSISATLSTFRLYTSSPWRPNYRSLLPFTQLKELAIDFSCEGGCSSTIDDGIITDIAQAMPKLEVLHLGEPCQTPTGVTAKGLAALA